MADTELVEYVCGENEKSVQRFSVTAAERQRARATNAVPREVLSKYEGTYVMGVPGGRVQDFVVEVVGNELSMKAPAGGRYTLVPESPTVFYITGQRVEFFLDAQRLADALRDDDRRRRHEGDTEVGAAADPSGRW